MKEKFIKSTIILTIGGLLTKILSMVIRIITTRLIGSNGIGLYMMVLPTFNLFITVATLSLPLAISKLVSEGTRNNKNVVLGIIPLSIIINIVLIIVNIFTSKYIACNLLKNSNLYYPIICIGITLPFISISSIIRGYFFGKEKMLPSVISNLVEQIIRILSIVIIVPKTFNLDIKYTISILVLLNVISELSSIIVLILFLPKNVSIGKKDIIPNYKNVKNILEISIPTTLSRIISSIGGFLEPVIITYVFLKLGYNNNFITNEYGIITGYVFPIVSLPSFLSNAIANALLPVISNKYQKKDYNSIKKKTTQAVLISFGIGLISTLFIVLFSKYLLSFIFNINYGNNYLKISSVIFLISYINGPIIAALQAINKAKYVMLSNIISIFIKTILLYALSFFDIGMYSLLISYFISFLFMTIYQIFILRKNLN